MTTRYPSSILATCCSTWDNEGQFVEGVFRRSVQNALAEGTPHLYVFGTAGEGYAVTDSQFQQVVRAFADEMRLSQAEPMVGVVHLSTFTMIERIQRSRELGVTCFQISLPSWGALSDRELYTFFDQVCGKFLDCTFLHYNLPRAKRMLTGEEYAKIADLHPNLVATKNCVDSMSHIRGLLEHAPQLQHFLSESGYIYGSMFEECSILASFIMNWPKLKLLFEAGKRHDYQTMVGIQRELNVVVRILMETVAGPHIDGAYDKIFEKMYDPEFPLRLLPPYLGATDDEYRLFVERLAGCLPDWVPAMRQDGR